MELDRHERFLVRGPAFGAMVAQRMMVTEGRKPQTKDMRKVKAMLAELPPSVQRVDVRAQRIEGLHEGEMWDGLRHTHPLETADFSDWRGGPEQGVSVSGLRSLSLSSGHTLKSCSLARTAVTDAMLEVFVPRLFALASLDLSDCLSVTNQGCRAVAVSCGPTLTSLNLSRCQRLTDECLGYITGTIGFGTACSLLQSLSMKQCNGVSDRGLANFDPSLRRGGQQPEDEGMGRSTAKGRRGGGRGASNSQTRERGRPFQSKGEREGGGTSGACRNLRFISLDSCENVSDKGIVSITKGCPQLQVLNVSHCFELSDTCLHALGRRCPELKSLALPGSFRVTDRGIAALARGCPQLQALNIASARAVSEKGLCVVAQACPSLQTLNITGCMEVSTNGLRALVDGVGKAFVMEARTFFGFLPRPDLVHQRVEEAQYQVETAAARLIQKRWGSFWSSLREQERQENERLDNAALQIQMAFQRHLRAAAIKEKVYWREADIGARLVQRAYRGYRVRCFATECRVERAQLMAKGANAIPIQAAFRGHLVRRQDQFVHMALQIVHRNRKVELQNAAAVRIAAVVRYFLSSRKCAAWSEVVTQRRRDEDHSAKCIQAVARVYISCCVLRRLKVEREVQRQLELRAAKIIQIFWRGCLGKYNGAVMLKEMMRLKRARHRKAIVIQAAFRGMLARMEWRRRFTIWTHHTACATDIQRTFRGSRVMSWQLLRLNAVTAYVLKRQELEVDERAEMVSTRWRKHVEDYNRDSCSEDEEVDEADAYWEEAWDEVQQMAYWFNSVLNERSDHRPFGFETGLIGRVANVYWPSEQASFMCTITKFHRGRGKHRLDYEDGDHEWMDLYANQERISLQTNGVWVEYRNTVDPDMVRQKLRAAALRKKEAANLVLFAQDTRWVKLWDEQAGKMRWFDEQSGVIRYAHENAEQWTMASDENADIVFINNETQEVEYEDPRFEDDDAEAKAKAKKALLDDLRFACYFSREMCQKASSFDELSRSEQMPYLKELVESPTYAKLGSAVARARVMFKEKQFEKEEELIEAVSMLQHMGGLRDWAQVELENAEEVKAKFLKGGTGQQSLEQLGAGEERSTGQQAEEEGVEGAYDEQGQWVVT